jgi:putative ABC transport system permease protein
MQLRPILASLRHHRLTSMLLVLQVAFTCAIVSNVAFLVAQRVQRVNVVSGLQGDSLSVLQVDDLRPGNNPLSIHRADLAALRTLPGVQSAAIVDNVPLSGSEDSGGTCGSLKAVHAAMAAHSIQVPGCAEPDSYQVGRDALQTLGLKLVAGRDFRADEYVPGTPGSAVQGASAVIITRALAQRLHLNGQAVGRSLYFGRDGFMKGQGARIVGVVRHMVRGNLRGDVDNDLSMLVPVVPNDGAVTFIVRTRPRDRGHVLAAAVRTLKQRRPQREISGHDARTYAQMRAAYFQRDTTMIGLLVASALGLLFVTALGIAGLASFWVGQRRRTIGIRRAVGATRGEIRQYFQTENFLIVGVGVMLGMTLAYGLNLWLMRHYELSRLPWFYLPLGAMALWLLGQLSVLVPARRAAKVPPVVATRSV